MSWNGRGGGIRTPGPLLPKQMRYQAALRPDLLIRLYRGRELLRDYADRVAPMPHLTSHKPG
jgi:hypothetical protein